MEPEQDMAGFLGVLIQKKEDRTMELTQSGLIACTINAMGLSNSKRKQSPAKKTPLVADKNGKPCNESFDFSSVVGMLAYLAGYTRPDIEYALHQCSHYLHRPRAIHEVALKRVG